MSEDQWSIFLATEIDSGIAKLGGFLEESDGELSISSLSWDYKLLPAEVSPSMPSFTRRKPER